MCSLEFGGHSGLQICGASTSSTRNVSDTCGGAVRFIGVLQCGLPHRGKCGALSTKMLGLFLGSGLVFSDFQKSLRKWSFGLNWMLSGNGVGFMIRYPETCYLQGRGRQRH